MDVFQYVVLKVWLKIHTFQVLHEWLSGGVSPCQGEGRGFESRLVLFSYVRNCLECKVVPGFFVLTYGIDQGRIEKERSKSHGGRVVS